MKSSQCHYHIIIFEKKKIKKKSVVNNAKILRKEIMVVVT